MSDHAPHIGGARPALVVACVGAVALLIVAAFDPLHAFRAYLIGWLFWLSTAMGATAFLMIHHLTGGRWGWPIRRPAEALATTVPFASLASLPLLLGLRYVFPWADADAVDASPLLRHRQPLFVVPFVLARAGVFLVLWSLLAWRLRAVSGRHDRTNDERDLARLRTLSAIGLVVYFVTMSLASVDWIASREVDWYSSTFGVVTVLGQAATGLCVLILAVATLRRAPAMASLLSDRAAHDLGNLLQTVVVLWAYVSFMQYLVIWSGNTQEDIVWFVHRTTGGWTWVGRALIVLHFGVPFALLLFQRTKRDLKVLAYVAGGVLVMRGVDLLWTIVPSNAGPSPRGLHWLDLVGLLTFAALGWACFAWQLGRAPLASRAATQALAEVTDHR